MEDGALVVAPVVTASLSADHRVSDGHGGAAFLDEVAGLLQAPETAVGSPADGNGAHAMDEQAIRDTLFAALRTVAPEVTPSEIAADQPLRDQVDLDSMDFLNFLVRLHEKLGVDVPESDYAKLVTLNDFVAYLGARLR